MLYYKIARGTMTSKIGEILVKSGKIKPGQLEEAIARQKELGGKLEEVLVKLGYIRDETVITETLLKQLNIGAIKLTDIELNPEIVNLIPADIAQKNKVVPVLKLGKILFVAMLDRTNLGLLDTLKFITGYEIQPLIVQENDLNKALEKYYGAGEVESISDIMDEVTESSEVEVVEETTQELGLAELERAIQEKPLVRLVDSIILNAIKMGASDIHIEPFEKTVRIRYRIDGTLREMTPLPVKLKAAVVSRIKIMAKLDISERRLPQDGRIKIQVEGRAIDLRVSVLPCIWGEKVVMRILDPKSLMLDITKLGFPERALKEFYRAITMPYGMVLVTGPTGSGKTTTLYSALQTLNTPYVNIMTAEDPVEFNIHGINQVLVRAEIGLTFASALRAFLRQDPNIILVGEIRDLETADIAIKAALTGHLVFSTLHTNDAPSTITRLVDMGIAPFLVASSVRMVIAQRLLKKICPYCKEPYEPEAELLEIVGITPEEAKNITFYRGKGCSECGGTGMKGRTAVFEVMPISRTLEKMIIEGASALELQEQAMKEGMLTLRQEAINKLKAGIVPIEQVIAETMG